jgi:hypothetical protein
MLVFLPSLLCVCSFPFFLLHRFFLLLGLWLVCSSIRSFLARGTLFALATAVYRFFFLFSLGGVHLPDDKKGFGLLITGLRLKVWDFIFFLSFSSFLYLAAVFLFFFLFANLTYLHIIISLIFVSYSVYFHAAIFLGLFFFGKEEYFAAFAAGAMRCVLLLVGCWACLHSGRNGILFFLFCLSFLFLHFLFSILKVSNS